MSRAISANITAHGVMLQAYHTREARFVHFPDMFEENRFAGKRTRVFADQVVGPMVYTRACPLDVSVYQCADRIPYAQAAQASYRPVARGFRFGPKWSTAWFHIQGKVPDNLADRCVVLRFASGTEALLYRDGQPVQGFDTNRDAAVLFESAHGGEPIDLHVEAACNHPFGVQTFEWESDETTQRWESKDPGLLSRCELAGFDRRAWTLYRTLVFAAELIEALPDGSARARTLARQLEQVRSLIDAADPIPTIEKALEALERAILNGAAPSATTCFAVGHAHLDTAWLWPIAETKRKTVRTFANVLRLMDRFDEFHFMCSQAQHYAWIRQMHPALFEQIRRRVQEGRWQPIGAMWVEPDANIPSGESLIRQIIHGIGFWTEQFGEHARQRMLFLPDTFGFSAIIPQIMALSGLDTFVTNKLWWSDRDEFAHVTFWWQGIDGTRVLGHLTPGQDYNATNTPAELRRGQMRAESKDVLGVWLQPFGFGDGGGGPTDWTILNARLAHNTEGLARTNLHGARAFCKALHERAHAFEADTSRQLPTCDGELYLHYHRGTLTTQARVKKANAVGEARLRLAEALAVMADRRTQSRTTLAEAWKLLLVNQFHDILPGSSIGQVYEDALADHARLTQIVDDDIRASLNTLATQADTQNMSRPMLVVNPLSGTWSGLTRGDAELFCSGLPALSVSVVDADAVAPAPEVSGDERTLCNDHLEAVIDELGRIERLCHRGSRRDAVGRDRDGRPIPLNQLVLYDDRPRVWDAWDIDPEHELTARPVESRPIRLESQRGPGWAAIVVERALGRQSHIRQRYVLAADSPKLDIETWIDWHEEHTLLRALFPVDLRTRSASYDLSFGHIDRPTTRSTPAEASAFEVPAHRWMSIGEPGFGVALLNDCKYGHSCLGARMGLTLLRSPKFPDPQADMGTHEFTCSLLLHNGDWRTSDLLTQAESMLNRPFAVAIDAARGQRRAWAPIRVHCTGSACAQVAALKPAEHGSGAVLRLVERHGARGFCQIEWDTPVKHVRSVDLLESRDLPLPGFEHTGARTVFEIRPFQIVTLEAG